MNKQLDLQTSKNVGRMLIRGGWLSLGLLFVATLVLYAARQSTPVLVGAGAIAVAQTDEAGAQGVADYLRVHQSIPDQALPLDPAAQSVADYLRVHSAVSQQQAAPDAAAARGVADYLRAHHVSASPASLDAATLGVLNYIRVHETDPDQVILELYRAHADRVD